MDLRLLYVSIAMFASRADPVLELKILTGLAGEIHSHTTYSQRWLLLAGNIISTTTFIYQLYYISDQFMAQRNEIH